MVVRRRDYRRACDFLPGELDDFHKLHIDAYDYYDPLIFERASDSRPVNLYRNHGMRLHPMLQCHHGLVNGVLDPEQILSLNSVGLRAPEAPHTEALRVCLLGGSVAMGWRAPSNESTPACFIEQLLNQRALTDRQVQVINCGQIGRVMWDHLLLLQAVVIQKYRPHVVVCLAGYNDFLSVLSSGPPGKSSQNVVEPIMHAMLSASFRQFGRSVLLRFLRNRYAWLNDMAHFYKRFGRQQPFAKPAAGVNATNNPPGERSIGDYVSHYVYVNTLMSILLNGLGITFVSALQPALGYGAKKLDPMELELLDCFEKERKGYRYSLRAFYEPLRTAMSAAALEKNFTFLDLSGVYDDVAQRIYVDTVHPGDRGYKILADKMCIQLAPLIDHFRALRHGVPGAGEVIDFADSSSI